MKKKVIYVGLFCISAIPLVNLTSCGSNKQDISAPSIISLVQETNSGNVFVNYGDLKTQSQAPGFSFDGGSTWLDAVKTDDHQIQILSYNSQKDNFTVAFGESGITFNVGVAITVVIRENETQNYNPSSKSDPKTLTLKRPTTSLNVVNETIVVGTVQRDQYVPEGYLDKPRYAACFDNQSNKYVLAKVTYSDIEKSQMEGFTKFKENIIKISDGNSYEIKYVSKDDFNLNEQELLKKYEQIEYQNFDGVYNIKSEDFVVSQTLGGSKCAKVIFRTKEGNLSLPSPTAILSIRENVIYYYPTSESVIEDFYFTQQSPTSLNFVLSNNKTLTMTEISTIFAVDRNSTYSNVTGSERLTNANAEIRDTSGVKRTKDITNQDHNTDVKLVFVNNSTSSDICSFDVHITYNS